LEKAEVHGLLVQISHIDNRIVDAGTVHMWWEIIGHYYYHEARDAVPVCFMESDSYLTPHRLVKAMKRAREDRAVEDAKAVTYERGSEVYAPDNLAEMTEFYRKLWQAHPWGENETPEGMAQELGWDIPVPRWGDSD
jgi:hypothetical protein